MAAKKPDVIVGGTQSEDAYSMVKSLVQLNYNPKFMYLSNGANSPWSSPTRSGRTTRTGIFSSADWFPGSTATGSEAFTKAYIAKFGGTAQQIDDSSAEAYAVGQLIEAVAQKTGKVDNATIVSSLHSGTWPTLLGDLSWDAHGAPQGRSTWCSGRAASSFPSTRRRWRRRSRSRPSPTGAAEECTHSSRDSSSGSSPRASTR